MAINKPKKAKAELPAAEKALADQIDRLSGIEKPTDVQKSQMKELRGKLGALRFVRIANKRVPKALKAVSGIANLAGAGYTKTPEQVKAIAEALSAAVKDVERKLSGGKQDASGFTLPTA